MTTLAEELSRYTAGLRYEYLPREVIHQAKRLIIDTVGCALGGYWSEPARIARDLASTVRSSEAVSVIGNGERTSPDLGAFANGVMIRFLDFNDGYTSTGESGHPSDSIAAVLSTAELRRRSGREAIVATVIAYEVFCRICDAVDLKPLGFDHVTVGCMASTAAAARLLGLEAREIGEAFNLGIAPNVALYQTRIGNVSMWKGCAYANASRNAVFAAMLAARGMTGPSPVFEGVGGYYKAVSGKPFELAPFAGAERVAGLDAETSPLVPRGEVGYKIMECSVKRFPLGQYSQTVVEAALQLRPRAGNADDIAEVRIETVTTAIKLMAGDIDKWEPKTRESADHSMPYTVAIALLYGEVEEKHFGDAYLRDPRVLDLTRRVKVKATEEADARMPEAMLCTMELVTRGGESHRAIVEYHKGHWKNPMSDGEIEAKYRKLGRELLTDAQADRLLDALWRLDELPDAGEIVRLTKSG
jgi:2-methylcitrate dehydratase